jgi:hypothetical protein
MKNIAASLSRSPTYQAGTSLLSAQIATYVHVSPAPSGAAFAIHLNLAAVQVEQNAVLIGDAGLPCRDQQFCVVLS